MKQENKKMIYFEDGNMIIENELLGFTVVFALVILMAAIGTSILYGAIMIKGLI